MVTYDADDNTSMHILLCDVIHSSLRHVKSGSGSPCRNFELVVLVRESTIYCPGWDAAKPGLDGTYSINK